MTTARPRGYALMIVLLAIAVMTGLVLRGLLLRPPPQPASSAVVAWHDAHAVLARCIDAFDLLDDERAPPPPGVPTSPLPTQVTHDLGTCRITSSSGAAAEVFTLDVLGPIPLRAMVVRPTTGTPFLVYAR